MESIGCIQGQGEGHREPLVLVPISEGIPQDVQDSFGVQESQEGLQDLHLAVRGAAWYSLATRGLVMGGGVGGGVGRMVRCNSYSNC